MIGPHGILTTDVGLAWARIAPIVKQIDRTDLLRVASGITVFRKYVPGQESYIQGMDVQSLANAIEQALGGFRPTYVEGYNEVAQRQGQGLEGYADWTEAFVAEMHKRGYKVAGFSFSTGNPGIASLGDQLDDIQYLYNRGWCGIDALAFHCYWGPTGFTPYHALRYRAAHTAVPSHPPFVITESGRDAVDGGGSGWKASGLSAEQYVGELHAYDALIAADSAYLLGATIFTAGPTSDWAAFSTDELNITGGNTVADTMTPQQERDQEEAQFSHEGEALYNMERFLEKVYPGFANDKLLQDARTHINAIDPEHFTF